MGDKGGRGQTAMTMTTPQTMQNNNRAKVRPNQMKMLHDLPSLSVSVSPSPCPLVSVLPSARCMQSCVSKKKDPAEQQQKNRDMKTLLTLTPYPLGEKPKERGTKRGRKGGGSTSIVYFRCSTAQPCEQQ